MKVGVYFGDYLPQAGGAHTFVGDILAAFAEKAGTSRHQFVFFCNPDAANSIREEARAANLEVVKVRPPSRFGKMIAGLKYLSPIVRLVWRRPGKFERLARAHDVEVLWFVGVGVYDSPDIPYVATIWDLQHRLQPFFPEVSGNGIWDQRELVTAYFLRRAAYCVTGTEIGKREIARFYQVDEARIKVIPFPTPRFALAGRAPGAELPKRLGIAGRFILYPAQFWPHKNHVNLVLALKWLHDQGYVDLSLVLPGSDKGNLDFVKRCCAKLGVSERVLFPGFVSADELIALYRQAQALSFVTYFGPDNMPPLEAFALGCPVIASNVEGAAEQYGEAAMLVDPSDPEEIGRALASVMSDGDVRKRLIAAGRERAIRWTTSNYVGQIFRVLDEFSAIRRNWT
jgi:glycosyltransferase involved in cell wall biosynthesis